jgi:hypothetical protein
MPHGVDYSFTQPAVSALKRAEIDGHPVRFVCRYLAPTPNEKVITKREAKSLHDAGISIVLVWESSADRALDGRDAGEADAREAERQANRLGLPTHRPIYFAVDFDAAASQQDEINSYFDGVARVLPVGRIGVYGGYHVVRRTVSTGHATWAWQTVAWSGGNLYQDRAIYQNGRSTQIGDVACGVDIARESDFGEWPKLGHDEPPESQVFRRVWLTDALTPPKGHRDDEDNDTWTAARMLRHAAWQAEQAAQIAQDTLNEVRRLTARADSTGS